MSDPLDGPITAKQMALLLGELKQDFGRGLDTRFAEQDARIERRLAEQTSELEGIVTAAVLGGADNVKRHLDRRLDDLTERVKKLEGGVEDPYRAPSRNDLG